MGRRRAEGNHREPCPISKPRSTRPVQDERENRPPNTGAKSTPKPGQSLLHPQAVDKVIHKFPSQRTNWYKLWHNVLGRCAHTAEPVAARKLRTECRRTYGGGSSAGAEGCHTGAPAPAAEAGGGCKKRAATSRTGPAAQPFPRVPDHSVIGGKG